MPLIKDAIGNAGVLNHVILPTEVELLLAGLEMETGPEEQGGGIFTGTVRLISDLSKSPIPGFDFSLAVPSELVKAAPFKLKLEPPKVDPVTGGLVNRPSFHLWLLLAEQEQVFFIFQLGRGLPGLALTGATKVLDADGRVTLDVLPDDDPKHSPSLVSRASEPGAALGPALLIFGSADTPARVRFTPDTDSTEGVVAFGLEPPTVVFGSSKIGFECPAIVIDDSERAKAPGEGAPGLDPPLASILADSPEWRGILARELDFYLPVAVPLFGGRPIHAYLAIAPGSGGAQLVIESAVPARAATPTRAEQPGYSIRIECLDPTATGLSGLAPTLISASMDLPVDGADVTAPRS